jgi:hypothetical protein
VVQQFVARLRRQILQEIEEAKAAAPPGWPSPPCLNLPPSAGLKKQRSRCPPAGDPN